MKDELGVKNFYDIYWPKNIPDYRKTEKHISSLLPDKKFYLALDAGCGTGVCSLALSSKADRVVSCDLSIESLKTALYLRNKLDKRNINFANASLLNAPFKDNTFDLILSWGVIHHTANPRQVFSELSRVLKRDGFLIAALYLRTNLTFLHEFLRKICLKIKNKRLKKIFITSIVYLVKISEKLGKKANFRDDNIAIASQVEDWFFVPIKHFFSIEEARKIFESNNLEFELLYEKISRFKSSTNFIARGRKK